MIHVYKFIIKKMMTHAIGRILFQNNENRKSEILFQTKNLIIEFNSYYSLCSVKVKSHPAFLNLNFKHYLEFNIIPHSNRYLIYELCERILL